MGETNNTPQAPAHLTVQASATVVTAKHCVFQFLDVQILADDALICMASDDAFHLGVLSSSLHGQWALVTGSTLENRPRYIKTTCFETFPFPDEDTGLTAELRERIAVLVEQMDAHRIPEFTKIAIK